MITGIYIMHGLGYDKTYVVRCILIPIALYEMIGYIIGNMIRLVNGKPCALLYECYVQAFI